MYICISIHVFGQLRVLAMNLDNCEYLQWTWTIASSLCVYSCQYIFITKTVCIVYVSYMYVIYVCIMYIYVLIIIYIYIYIYLFWTNQIYTRFNPSGKFCIAELVVGRSVFVQPASTISNTSNTTTTITTTTTGFVIARAISRASCCRPRVDGLRADRQGSSGFRARYGCLILIIYLCI